MQNSRYSIYLGAFFLLASVRAFSGLENLKTSALLDGHNVTGALSALGIFGVSYGEQVLQTTFDPFNTTLSLNLAYNSTYVPACPTV
jgi:hypothetical protein